jgi:hypothetical protein
MSIPFPSTLQQNLNQGTFNQSFGDTSIRTQMDIGPAKVRRRTTRPINILAGSIFLTSSEYSVFETFYNTTINGGASAFTIPHPITGVSGSFRFTKPPSLRDIGPTTFLLSMEWEQLN